MPLTVSPKTRAANSVLHIGMLLAVGINDLKKPGVPALRSREPAISCDWPFAYTCAWLFPLAYLSDRNHCTRPAPRSRRSFYSLVHRRGRSRSRVKDGQPCRRRSSFRCCPASVVPLRTLPKTARELRRWAQRRLISCHLAKLPAADVPPWEL